MLLSVGSDDSTIRLWSTEDGKQIRMFDGLGKVLRALFCRNDEHILIEMTKKLSVRSLKSGNIRFTYRKPYHRLKNYESQSEIHRKYIAKGLGGKIQLIKPFWSKLATGSQ